MAISRPQLYAAGVVACLVLLVGAGLAIVEVGQMNVSCAKLTGASCDAALSPELALAAVIASVTGLLAAVGLAMALGMNWKRGGTPNASLAKAIESEEAHLQDYRLRRAQLDEWTGMAAARAAEKAAAEIAAAQAAAEAEAAFIAEASRWIEEEEETVETAEDEKRRVLAEHMAHLARVKPEAVAEVLRMWINQPVR